MCCGVLEAKIDADGSEIGLVEGRVREASQQ